MEDDILYLKLRKINVVDLFLVEFLIANKKVAWILTERDLQERIKLRKSNK